MDQTITTRRGLGSRAHHKALLKVSDTGVLLGMDGRPAKRATLSALQTSDDIVFERRAEDDPSREIWRTGDGETRFFVARSANGKFLILGLVPRSAPSMALAAA